MTPTSLTVLPLATATGLKAMRTADEGNTVCTANGQAVENATVTVRLAVTSAGALKIRSAAPARSSTQ